MTHPLLPFLFALVLSFSAKGQSLLTFAGGNVSGSGFDLSWSVGEIVILTTTNGTNTATQGYQQPIDIEETDTSNITVNVITPNGDGINDKFLINNVENLPDNRLLIINRWREVVYEKSNYQNDWEGITNHGTPLPQAAYYYYFYKDKKVRKPDQGVIHVIRG